MVYLSYSSKIKVHGLTNGRLWSGYTIHGHLKLKRYSEVVPILELLVLEIEAQ